MALINCITLIGLTPAGLEVTAGGAVTAAPSEP